MPFNEKFDNIYGNVKKALNDAKAPAEPPRAIIGNDFPLRWFTAPEFAA